ncbi:MAG: ribosome biogenesis GTPase Der [Phycisphaerales bacterium]|nr:ribosome biogenesis GTPase Der [Planctomycetota bacterium]MCH8509951.1 ribosome biogenesis GTPase Der [Phycisphaerales bacterium]
MPVPRVAIVGRPNVGKSSLLNLIAQERIAIVDPTPGVTRDRLSVIVDLQPPDQEGPVKPVELTDTGGFGVYVAQDGRYNEVGEDLATLTKDIEFQIAAAVSGADLILFAIDVQAGITAQDEAIAQMLREQKLGRRDAKGSGKNELTPVRVVGTKCDGPKWEAHGYELAALGFDEPLLVSSTSKYFRRDFLDTLYELVPLAEEGPAPEADLQVAIVGKRNVGKSTLINALAGEPRVIVSEIAGTTRDAVDVKFEYDGKSVVAIDTAGLRRKKSFQDQIEWYALDRAQRAIDRCDVVLLLLDASEPISQVDEHLAQMVMKSWKPVVIVVNKWDLAQGRADPKGRPVTPGSYEDYIRKELKGLSFAPIAMMSARDGLNIRATMDLAMDLNEQASTRVGTGQLNRLVGSILEDRGPTNRLGQEARVYFASQVKTHPPTIVLVVNDPDRFTQNYERFLMNRLREALPYDEVPIRLILRAKHRVDKRAKAGKGSLHAPDAQTGAFDTDLSPEQIDTEALLADLPDDASAYFDD